MLKIGLLCVFEALISTQTEAKLLKRERLHPLTRSSGDPVWFLITAEISL